MPGQSGSEKRQRDHVYTIRLDDAEKARLDQIANHSGIARADVIRRMLVHDHSRIVPSRELTQEIARIGQNVNQIAKALNRINAQDGLSPGWTHTLALLDGQRHSLRKSADDLVRIRRNMEWWR